MRKLAKTGLIKCRAQSILLAALVFFTTTASAGTIHVFAENLGTGSFQSPDQEAYASFLKDSDIDFGFFCGPNAGYKVGFSNSAYTANKITAATGGIHAFVYKTSRWTVVDYYKTNYPKGSGEEWQSVTSAYVLEDKATSEQFAFVMTTGTAFDRGSYLGPVTTTINWCKNNYPNARIVVGVTKAYGLHVGSGLADHIKGLGFTEVREGTGCGAIYAQNHASRSTCSGSAVSWLSGAAEPAATATVTYRQQFTVSFEDWDGTSLGEAQKVYAGDDATPPADPSREGYTFTGWSGSYENIQANATLVAQYAINTYTVRFLDYNGNVLKSEMVDYGSDATPPADPTREGYRFTGWQGDYTGITADTDITATYVDASVATHWVTFFDWDGTQLSQQEIEEGEDAIPPADPDNKTGWHFTGWSGSYTNVQQDETVTATYAINTYTVQFLGYDNTLIKSEVVTHGADAIPPADPERTGYTFTGWQGIYENVAADSTVVAQYSINTYTVTFQYTNGVVIVQQTVEYLGSATKPANPAPIEENTVFYHWDGSYSSVTADTEVTAIFIPKVIEIGTAAEFAAYMGNADLIAMSAITFALTNDISLTGVSFTKRDMAASLDGRGHTLYNIPSNFKLANSLRGNIIRNICFSGFRSPVNNNASSLIASATYVNSVISGVVMTNCYWTAQQGSYGTAGFVYEVKQATTITNCVMIDCKVTGTSCGGNYKGEPQLMGGFVSKASGLNMVDCHFIVTDTNEVAIGNEISVAGAFVGKSSSNVTLTRCSNNGHVKVAKSVYSNIGGAGGFVGIATSSGSPTIVDCANFGKVDATVNYPAGGFIGDVGSAAADFSLTLRSSFNYGDISSPVAAGGLVGSFRGAKNKLNNNGNSGAIASDAGFAGGLVGRVLCVGDNKSFGFANALQVGAVSTESGLAGTLVGGIEGSTGSELSMVVSNVFMAGSAVATDGGQAGLLFGGRDTVSENEMAIVMDNCQVLKSNAALPHYYDKDNAPASLEESPTTFGVADLSSWKIRNALNAYVSGHSGYTWWIQGKNYPELETFGTEVVSGFMLFVR